CERLSEGLASFDASLRAAVEILFSAHGLPESFIRAGDPYAGQIQATFDAARARFPGRVFHLAYQSRVGPVKWIGPSMTEKIAELGARGVQRLLVVPVSFVSDHIETLYEIDIEYARQARAAGIAEFRRVRSLNGSPAFIGLLADLVMEKLEA
ncbi:MAG: ferrochelatase, partial [Candidatus Sumerlaeota bacterium]|nr:ferrochelatase [Candidatus Sumerlaeota bacterium]